MRRMFVHLACRASDPFAYQEDRIVSSRNDHPKNAAFRFTLAAFFALATSVPAHVAGNPERGIITRDFEIGQVPDK